MERSPPNDGTLEMIMWREEMFTRLEMQPIPQPVPILRIEVVITIRGREDSFTIHGTTRRHPQEGGHNGRRVLL